MKAPSSPWVILSPPLLVPLPGEACILEEAASGEPPSPKLRARVTEELAEHLSRGGDCVHQVGEILAVLDERVRVTEPFDDDALRFVVVELGVVLERPGVLSADNFLRTAPTGV
jgi:hypothetical protein